MFLTVFTPTRKKHKEFRSRPNRDETCTTRLSEEYVLREKATIQGSERVGEKRESGREGERVVREREWGRRRERAWERRRERESGERGRGESAIVR